MRSFRLGGLHDIKREDCFKNLPIATPWAVAHTDIYGGGPWHFGRDFYALGWSLLTMRPIGQSFLACYSELYNAPVCGAAW